MRCWVRTDCLKVWQWEVLMRHLIPCHLPDLDTIDLISHTRWAPHTPPLPWRARQTADASMTTLTGCRKDSMSDLFDFCVWLCMLLDQHRTRGEWGCMVCFEGGNTLFNTKLTVSTNRSNPRTGQTSKRSRAAYLSNRYRCYGMPIDWSWCVIDTFTHSYLQVLFVCLCVG